MIQQSNNSDSENHINSKRQSISSTFFLFAAGASLLTLILFSSAITSVLSPSQQQVQATATGLDPLKLSDPLPRNLFIELKKLIDPTVVSITSAQVQKQYLRRRGGGGPFRDPLFDLFEDMWGLPPGALGGGGGGGRGGGGGMAPPPTQQAVGMGSGFIISPDGKIITNNHVIAQADVIKVQLDPSSKQEFEAKVIGRDERTDIALIKIDAKKTLPTAALGSSSTVQVGEWVTAFGNPYMHTHTMTKGIISGIGREIPEINRFPFLQTDAAIYPGNSGGPLVNTQGQVIGVNTAIDARAAGGIGFAIPIDFVKPIIAQLEKDGKVKRGVIGVQIQPLPPELAYELGLVSAEGVIINTVIPKGPADKAGLQMYDIILEFNGKPTRNVAELQNAVADAPIGSKNKIKVLRFSQNDLAQGKAPQKKTEKTFDVVVADSSSSLIAGASGEEGGDSFGSKRTKGINAKYGLGMAMAESSAKLRSQFGISKSAPDAPIILDVEPDSPAEAAGLRPGDLIVNVNRQKVSKPTDVNSALRRGAINFFGIQRGDTNVIVMLQSSKTDEDSGSSLNDDSDRERKPSRKNASEEDSSAENE